MQLDELTPVLPERDWDELITASMRRGRTLRRRRRLMASSPLAALLAVIVAIPLSGVFEPNHDGLARLHTTNVGPAQTTDVTPAPDGTPSADPVQQTTTHPGTLPAGPASGQPLSRRVGPGPVVPSNVAAAGRGAVDTVRPLTVAYPDPQGDAAPQAAPGAPAAPAPSSASDPTLDIVRMSFTADRDSLRVTMDLLGDYRTDGYYMAYFNDARTGCAYSALLGGAYHDQIFWTCGSDSGADFVQGTPDTARRLSAVFTWADLRGGVRPHDAFTSLNGETRLVHPAGGQWPYDEAATSKVLRVP